MRTMLKPNTAEVPSRAVLNFLTALSRRFHCLSLPFHCPLAAFYCGNGSLSNTCSSSSCPPLITHLQLLAHPFFFSHCENKCPDEICVKSEAKMAAAPAVPIFVCKKVLTDFRHTDSDTQTPHRLHANSSRRVPLHSPHYPYSAEFTAPSPPRGERPLHASPRATASRAPLRLQRWLALNATQRN